MTKTYSPERFARIALLTIMFAVFSQHIASAHERTMYWALAKLYQPVPENLEREKVGQPSAQVKINILNAATGQPTFGTVRITNENTGRAWWPVDWMESPAMRRVENWWSVDGVLTASLKPGDYLIEAIGDLDTKRSESRISLNPHKKQSISLNLESFADMQAGNWWAGNTHMHMLQVHRAFADKYLEIVPAADGLNVVFVSYLERPPEDLGYISNEYRPESLKKFNSTQTNFGFGQETRNNFGAYEQGYGHALMLGIGDILKPVSIGPALNKQGTDYPGLKPLLIKSSEIGATNIWAHNDFGLEDIPSWIAGRLHAQNILDGNGRTHYEETFYRYLNIGLKVPFSSGTDWFILDFSRAYVHHANLPSPAQWLAAMRSGKSFITNGPLLTFNANGKRIGDSLRLTHQNNEVHIQGNAKGRADFQALEVIFNGEIIGKAFSDAKNGYYEAFVDQTISLSEPGWLALRIPWDNNKNEFGETIRAHTSPIYVAYGEKETAFSAATAQGLIAELEASMKLVRVRATFENVMQRESVLDIYREGIQLLQKKIDAHNQH